MFENGQPGRVIHPILFTAIMIEFFHSNISDKELQGMVDKLRSIRFCKIFDWMLPMFNGKSFYEYFLAGMHNFMLHTINTKGWKPKYYHPANSRVIVTGDFTCFFGCQLVRSLRRNPLIDNTWLTHRSLNAIDTCMECMPKNAFKDIYTYLHFDNNWDKKVNKEWDKVYVNKNNAVRKTRHIAAGASTIGGRSL